MMIIIMVESTKYDDHPANKQASYFVDSLRKANISFDKSKINIKVKFPVQT